jgi:L-ornithine N5-oxygenase
VVDHRVDVLAIGAGPANLALAVALEECAPDVARNSMVIEQYPDIKWQRNLLLPWARSQVSFLKDLVTLRNPCSRFSFLNFKHSQGRLDEFINLGTFHPYRSEISDYLQWVASGLEHVRIRYGARVQHIAVDRDTDGSVRGWTVTLSDGDTVSCRDLVFGGGRDAHVPETFRNLPADRVIHSSRYGTEIAELDRDRPYRVVVIGGAQSAAEMFLAVHQDLPLCQPTIVMRSIGFQNYQTSKFINELFFPSFVDEFFDCDSDARAQILDEMRLTNYAGLAPPFLDELYTMLYRQRLDGGTRTRVVTLTDVAEARMEGGDVVLDLRSRKTGKVEAMHCDLLLLGTGYEGHMPGLIRDLQPRLNLDRITVSRNYRVNLDEPGTGGLYLQGVSEDTHGIADSLISVLAIRSADIVGDMLARRQITELAGAAPAGSRS